MDLISHVRAFVAVAEAGSFTRGAEACGVPQPVVSRRVSNLEKHLGGLLVRRTSRTVDLTDLGRALLPHARDLAARAEHFVDIARAHTSEVVVAVPVDTDARALVATRRVTESDGPLLEFAELAPDARDRALAARRVGAALVASPHGDAIMSAPLGAGTTAGAPRGRRVHLDQLRRNDENTRPRVLHLDAEDDVPWVRDPLLRAARDAGLRVDQVRIGSTRTETLTSVLEYADVAVCTPAWADKHDLLWREFGGITATRSYRLAYPPGDARSPGIADAALPALARAVGLEAAAGAVPEPPITGEAS